jgi:hypothetical protein
VAAIFQPLGTGLAVFSAFSSGIGAMMERMKVRGRAIEVKWFHIKTLIDELNSKLRSQT